MFRYDKAMMDYTTPAIMHHRAIEKQSFASSPDDADADAGAGGAEAPANMRNIEAAKSSVLGQALATQPQHRTSSQINMICNSLLSNPFFKMQPTPLQPDIAAHLVLLDVPAGEMAISEVFFGEVVPKLLTLAHRSLQPYCINLSKLP